MASAVSNQVVPAQSVQIKVEIGSKYVPIQCLATDTIGKLAGKIRTAIGGDRILMDELKLFAHYGWCCCKSVEELTDLDSSVETLKNVSYVSYEAFVNTFSAHVCSWSV